MTAVVPYQADARQWIELMSPAAELAKAVADTEFVPRAMRGKPAQVVAAILYGDEVGLGPMQSLSKIAVIDGKPTLAAEAQRALILAAGHDLWIDESTITRCVIAGRRRESDATSRVTWTLDDAKRANLAGKQNWRTYPRQMLLARASAELARAIFADVIGGLAATEEIEDAVVVADADAAGNGTDPPAPPAPTRRRRRQTTTAATVSAPPPAATEPDQPPLPDELEQPARASDAQRRKLHAMFREHGIEDRRDRLDYCARVVGHPVASSTELTADEASAVIDELTPDEHDDAEPEPDGDTITHERADILNWMRRECDVNDDWTRAQLKAITGRTHTGPITVSVLQQLTSEQAVLLHNAFSDVLDARQALADQDAAGEP